MAPRVEFHTGIADDIGYTCRLLRKAYGQGVRVQVLAPPATLQRLDRELWTFVEREFVPHLRLPTAAARTPQALRTPIWLVDGAVPAADGPAVLVNLGAEIAAPQGGLDSLDGLTRLIEIVGLDADDAQRGRARWRSYKALGLAIEHRASG